MINYHEKTNDLTIMMQNHGINLYGLTIVLTHSPISQPQRHVALDQATVVRSTLPWRHGAIAQAKRWESTGGKKGLIVENNMDRSSANNDR